MSGFDAATVALTGRHLVEASAGTGKTHAIATLYVRLLTETDLTVRQVLVVTFTEAATAELRERLRGRLQTALAELEAKPVSHPVEPQRSRLVAALADFDGAAIHTIHGFCHRVLRERSFEVGAAFDAELLRESKRLRQDVLTDFLVQVFGGEGRSADAWDPPRSLEEFQKLTQNALAHERIVIEPPLGGAARLDALLADVGPLFDRARLAELVSTRTRQRKHVDGWLDAVGEWLAGRPVERKNVATALGHLSLPALRERLKKGFDTIEDPFLARAEQLRNALLDDWPDAELVHRAVEFVRVEEARRKQVANVLTFDDLLRSVHQALRDQPGAAERLGAQFGAALIDEFQDTDPLQFDIFRRLFGRPAARVFWVGDPKQAIYGFRGADVFAYLEARREPNVEVHTMTTNWRSDPCVLRGLNAMFQGESTFVLPGIEAVAVEPRPNAEDALRIAPNAKPLGVGVDIVTIEPEVSGRTEPWLRRAARATAQEVVALLESGSCLGPRPLVPGDLAVLTRKNSEVFAVYRALAEAGVPAVALADQSVFEADEAAELLDWLVAIEEPTSGAKLRRALVTPLAGCTAEDLIREPDADAEESEALAAWADRVREWNDLWQRVGFIQMMRAVLDGEGRSERLLGEVGGDRRLTNLLHLTELLHAQARADRLGPAGLVQWLRQQIDACDRTVEEHLVRLESDQSVVQITTMHRAKGLEYGVVFCPYLDNKVIADGVFHRGQDLVCDLRNKREQRPPEHVRAQQTESLAEDVRLLYVALTRAIHRAVVLTPKDGAERSAWAYLLHRPDLESAATPFDAFGKPKDRAAQEATRLAGWSEASAGAVRVRSMTKVGHRVWSPPSRAAIELAVREAPTGAGRRSRRRSSFTALVAGAEVGHEPHSVEDEPNTIQATVAVPSGERILLADFPRGTRAGLAVHEVFERMHESGFEKDASARAESARATIERELQRHGIDPREHAGPLLQVVESTLAAELLPGLSLSATCSKRREAEVEFHVPIGVADPASPAALAAAMRVGVDGGAGAMLPAAYVDSIERLQFAALRGFVRGFIDLVFEHAGRYFVLDWKSNYLGEQPADYGADGLARAMADGHYHLQSHLYSLALHRLLRWRLLDYDYDRHFGGSLYVFVRGVTGAPTGGVFFERPPRARMDALDALCASESRP